MLTHEELFVVDGHCDSICARADHARNLIDETAAGHVDIPRLQRAGVKAQVLGLWVADEYLPYMALHRTLILIEAANSLCDETTNVRIVKSVPEILKANKTGAISLILSLEGAEALQGSLEVLRALNRLGIMMFGLTWNRRNAVADGIWESSTGGGLTRFGREVIREMQRMEMVVDMAHLAPAGFWDVAKMSEAPLVVSHANAYKLCPHPRNLSDEQLMSIGRSGGLVGVCFYSDFVDAERSKCSVSRIVDHIEYIANLIGPEHVALGSDFDGAYEMAEGLHDVTGLPGIFMELYDRGVSDHDIAAIAGNNWLRVLGNDDR